MRMPHFNVYLHWQPHVRHGAAMRSSPETKGRRGVGVGMGRVLAVLLAAATTGVIAGEYRVGSDSPDPAAPVCAAMKQALSEGAINDVRKPVCRRRLNISCGVDGLTSPSLQSVSLKDHRDLLVEMLMITGAPMAREQAARIADDVVRSSEARIYTTRLDPDNGGRVRKIYVLDNTTCAQEWFSNPASPVVYVEAPNGALDPYWGQGSQIMGHPFFYKGKTYYAQWLSNGGRRPPALSLFEPLIESDFNRSLFKHEGFARVCSIEQK